MKLRFLDLFAGAGGLSEGFVRSGYFPIAHVEIDQGACFTLKTRLAYHWLKENGRSNLYEEYLQGDLTRSELYSSVPHEIISSVINEEISEDNLPKIFKLIDRYLGNNKLDLIIGGPPCQAYSIVGRSRDKNRMQGDKRNYLYKYYAQFLKRYQPKYFVFENVLGLLSAKDHDGELYFEKMKVAFKEIGYSTEYEVLDSSDYEIPQVRKRIILIGKLKGEKDFYPKIEKSLNKISVSNVLEDLPHLNHGEGTHKLQKIKKLNSNSFLFRSGIRSSDEVSWHLARPHNIRDLGIYKIAVSLWTEQNKRLQYNLLPDKLKTHKNRKSFLDRFKVVAIEKPSHTIVAHISKDGHYYIHPDIQQNRSLTVREAARIQTFPDDFYFESISGQPSRTSAFKQIGNAVPVLLAQKIATKLKESFE